MKTKEEMKQERLYTKEVLTYLHNELGRGAGFVDRRTGYYRIKVHNELAAKKLEEHFPGVNAVLSGFDAWHNGAKTWCVRVPFVKPEVNS